MTDIEHVATPPPVPAVAAEAEYLNLLWKLARMTTNTEMVPKTLRGRPDAALAVMAYGHELGLRPMTSLRGIFIIEGTPSCSAKLMRALIYQAGHTLEFREQSATKVVMYGERADGKGKSLVEWTIEDAKNAQLLGKDVWKRYPKSMLKARATSELARDIFPDIEVGYTPEELSRVDLSTDYDYLDVDEVDIPPDVDEAASGSDADAAELVDQLTLDADAQEEP